MSGVDIQAIADKFAPGVVADRLRELMTDRVTLREACDAAAWEQDHGGCDCRACTVLMDAALDAIFSAASGSSEAAS